MIKKDNSGPENLLFVNHTGYIQKIPETKNFYEKLSAAEKGRKRNRMLKV